MTRRRRFSYKGAASEKFSGAPREANPEIYVSGFCFFGITCNVFRERFAVANFFLSKIATLCDSDTPRVDDSLFARVQEFPRRSPRKFFSAMRSFFQTLWPDAESRSGVLTIWTLESQHSEHIPLVDISLLDDELTAEIAARQENTYFGLAARVEDLPPRKRGGKKECIAIPGFAMDIDFFNPKAHKAENLPKDLDEALEVLVGVPDPSLVVSTGNGIHAYWLFDKPFELGSHRARVEAGRASKAWQEPLRDASRWHIDQTWSIDRIWRIPGFVNQKTGRLVELIHESDVRYSWAELGLDSSLSVEGSATSEPVPEIVTTTADLDAVRAALRAIDSDNRYYEAVQALLRGDSLADRGERDHVLQGVCATVAWLPEGRTADPDELAELFRPSLSVWANEPDAAKTIEEELAKASDKILRSQEDWHAQHSLTDKQKSALLRAVGKSENDASDTVDWRCVIVQHSSTYFVYNFKKEEFSRRLIKEEVLLYADRAWEGVKAYSTSYINEAGDEKTKTVSKLLLDYGVVVSSIEADLTITQSYLDRDRDVFVQLAGKRRSLKPQFDPLIDEWLHLVFKDHYEKGCDWLASLFTLDKPCCALYLQGPSGACKSVFSDGIAKLWEYGKSIKYTRVAQRFNAESAKSPFHWIDEGIKKKERISSRDLRTFIAETDFEVEEKGHTPYVVKGCRRLLVAANSDKALCFDDDEEMTVDDMHAVAVRFLHVQFGQEVVDFFSKHNEGWELTTRWKNGGMAAHCLYLIQNRSVKLGRRFVVDGDETSMHRSMAMQGITKNHVYEWLARFACDPDKVYARYAAGETKRSPAAVIGDGQLLVNTQGVKDCWSVYMDDRSHVTLPILGSALKNLSLGEKRLAGRKRYHAIKPEYVLDWLTNNQVGDDETFISNLNSPRTIRVGEIDNVDGLAEVIALRDYDKD